MSYVVGRGWAVIEFNTAWGAGLNGCDPGKVWSAVIAAAIRESRQPAEV